MSDRQSPRPPRLFEALISRLLPAADRDPVLGDLAEEYGLRVRTGGLRRAGRWYRRQVAKAVLPAVRRRLRSAADPVGVSWLDVKLGLRMLSKRPIMTLAALLALTVGIPASVLPGHVARVLEAPLPEDSGDRIRSLRFWDQILSRPVAPTYFELERWRAELTVFDALGAFRAGGYNVRAGEAPATLVLGAEITASTFGLLGAVPLLGRTLDAADERPGAPPVAVVGYDLWRARLAGSPEVVGSTVDVGGRPHTIVGVMPADFLFPGRQRLWLPLRQEALAGPAQGRALHVFGRLAPGVSAAEADVAVASSARRIAVDFPASNQRLAGEMVRFGTAELALPRGGWRTLNDHRVLRVLATVLLVVAAGNVAMLVFAGTTTRFRELAIRTSLGATRRRIVSQMFVESSLLAALAVGLGLFGFQLLVARVEGLLLASSLGGIPPYWMRFGLTPPTIVAAICVAVLSASIAGVLPALKVTGSSVQRSIGKAEAARSGIRFGGVTGALIVADVAIAVGVVGLAIGTLGQIRSTLDADERVGIAADEYLAMELSLSSNESVAAGGTLHPDALAARLAATQEELVERLRRETRVLGVAVADRLPRQDHNHRRIALEGETGWLTVEGRPGALVPPLLPVARVHPDFFDALGRGVLAGRAFGQADLQDSVSTAIVNTSFVEQRMGGRNPIGQRLRFWAGNTPEAGPEERWHEIVGVVGPLGMNVAMPQQDGGVYLPAGPGEIHPMRVAVHVAGDPEAFAPRLREIASEVDPTAVVQPPRVLGGVYQGMYYFYLASAAALAVIAAILVALAASGIYAMMSFSVSARTREIGIRRSLGERTSALALRVGRRSMAQVAAGALLGVWPAMLLYRLTELGYRRPTAVLGWEVAVAAGIGVAAVVGLLACVSPTRRALRIEPSEALRADG